MWLGTHVSSALFARHFPAYGGIVGVFAALGAGPGGGAVRVSPYLPGRFVLEAVLPSTFRPEVLRTGIAVRERAVMSRSQARAGLLQVGNTQVPSRAITNSARCVGGRYRVVPKSMTCPKIGSITNRRQVPA